MSAIFEALHAGLETLEGDRDVLYAIRVALDALHEISHEHEDWLNRPHRVRIAARRLLHACNKKWRSTHSTNNKVGSQIPF